MDTFSWVHRTQDAALFNYFFYIVRFLARQELTVQSAESSSYSITWRQFAPRMIPSLCHVTFVGVKMILMKGMYHCLWIFLGRVHVLSWRRTMALHCRKEQLLIFFFPVGSHSVSCLFMRHKMENIECKWKKNGAKMNSILIGRRGSPL